MKQITATVRANSALSTTSYLSQGRRIVGNQIMQLRCPELPRPRAGQFIMVRCGECTLPRPFSIHRVGGEHIHLLFSVWEDGKGTKWLSQRGAGDNVEIFGPLGNSFSIHPDSRNLLLIAGGVGLAPLSLLAEQAVRQHCSVTLLLGVQTKTQLEPQILVPQEVNLVMASEDGTVGEKGRVTDLLPHFSSRADQIFACGPLGMYRDMYTNKKHLLEQKPVQVSLEVRMGCGFGVCYGCTVKTKNGLKQVCKDGPVFELDDILWDEIV